MINLSLVAFLAAATFFLPGLTDWLVMFFFLFGLGQAVANNCCGDPDALFDVKLHPMIFGLVFFYKLSWAAVYAFTTGTPLDWVYHGIVAGTMGAQMLVLFLQRRFPDQLLLANLLESCKKPRPPAQDKLTEGII